MLGDAVLLPGRHELQETMAPTKERPGVVVGLDLDDGADEREGICKLGGLADERVVAGEALGAAVAGGDLCGGAQRPPSAADLPGRFVHELPFFAGSARAARCGEVETPYFRYS